MDTLESEYEARLLEVQTDLSSARKQLQEQQSAMRGMEKDKSKIIQELMEQNQRLTRELKEVRGPIPS